MKNWKTSIFGTIFAIASASIPALQGKTQLYAQLTTAIAGTLLAIFAKDAITSSNSDNSKTTTTGK